MSTSCGLPHGVALWSHRLAEWIYVAEQPRGIEEIYKVFDLLSAHPLHDTPLNHKLGTTHARQSELNIAHYDVFPFLGSVAAGSIRYYSDRYILASTAPLCSLRPKVECSMRQTHDQEARTTI
jgi:hypothetical protein